MKTKSIEIVAALVGAAFSLGAGAYRPILFPLQTQRLYACRKCRRFHAEKCGSAVGTENFSFSLGEGRGDAFAFALL